MSKILSPDNAFFSTLNKIVDVMWLSLLWSIMCLPFFWFVSALAAIEAEVDVTVILFGEMAIRSIFIGPATTALYYTLVKSVRRERGYATRQFFHSFKENFKPGCAVSITITAFAYLMYLDFQLAIGYMNQGATLGNVIYIAQFCASAFVLCIAMWIFPILSRFKIGYLQLFKNAFYISIKHFPSTFLMIALVGGALYLVVFHLSPDLYILIPAALPGASMLLRSFIIEPVLKKYTAEPEGTEEETGEDRWYTE